MARAHHRLQVDGGSVPGIHDLSLFLIPNIRPGKTRKHANFAWIAELSLMVFKINGLCAK